MKKSERTRQWIIERSAPLFNKKGMAGTSISDIMEATQLAKGGVYGNFESKEEICREAFSYLVNGLACRLDAAVAKQATAKKKLFALLDCYNGDVCTQGGCPILNFGSEADDTQPEVKQRVSQEIESGQRRFSDLVELGIANGEFSSDFDAGRFAIMAFAMIEGGLLVAGVQNNAKQLRTIVDMLKAEVERYSN